MRTKKKFWSGNRKIIAEERDFGEYFLELRSKVDKLRSFQRNRVKF